MIAPILQGSAEFGEHRRRRTAGPHCCEPLHATPLIHRALGITLPPVLQEIPPHQKPRQRHLCAVLAGIAIGRPTTERPLSCNETSFDVLRNRRHDASVFLYAFDLIELDGSDLRREPLEVRKATLISVLAKAVSGVRLNEHMECNDGEMVFRHACKLGLEGIVSKRRDSLYRSGRSPDWLKSKNPTCKAVRREAEEDWRR
jgi:ATP dependent DNA ligase domain